MSCNSEEANFVDNYNWIVRSIQTEFSILFLNKAKLIILEWIGAGEGYRHSLLNRY